MKAPVTTEHAVHAEQSARVRGWVQQSNLAQRFLLLCQGSYFRSVFLLTSGVAVGQVITLASALLLARIYAPENFGVLAIYISVVALIATVSALRYEMAIPLPAQQLQATELLTLSVGCLLAVTSLLSAAVFFWGSWLVDSFGGDVLRPYLWLLPGGVLIAGIYQILASWTVRQQEYAHLARASVLQAAALAVGQISMGLCGLGTLGLISGDVVGRGCGSGTLLAGSWRTLSVCWPKLTSTGIIAAARRYWRFPAISSWAALLNTASVHMPLVLFACFYDLEIVGCLALAQRILGAPTSLLSNSVAKVYLGECARLRNEAPQNLLRLFWKTVLSQGAFALVLFVGVGLPAPWLFGSIFGAQWQLAGWCALLLSATYMAKMIAFPVGTTLDVLEKQGLHILRELIRLALAATAVLVAARLKLEPLAAVGVLSLASCLAYSFGVGIVWYAIRGSHLDDAT